MARVLFLHGSGSGPRGGKPDRLESNGHPVVARPRLPYPRYPRRSWRWVTAGFDRRWFQLAVEEAQRVYDDCRPDLIVGVSMGGAVAMNLATGATPLVLVAPAWKAWPVLHFGKARTVKPATVILHGERDRIVLPRYSRQLLANSPPSRSGRAVAQTLQDHLHSRLGEVSSRFALEGRLVLLRREGHRCKSDFALGVLVAAVEALVGVPGAV